MAKDREQNRRPAKAAARRTAARRLTYPGQARPAPRAPPGETPALPEGKPARIEAIGYGPGGYEARQIHRPEELREFRGRHPVCWIDVAGVHDAAALEQIGAIFQLHPLLLEDIAQGGQRPKLERYESLDFLVLYQLHRVETLELEQVSVVLGEGWVLTFHAHDGETFEPIRKRLRDGGSLLRRRGADYLAYAIADTIVDHFFPVLEDLEEQLEALEERILIDPRQGMVTEIHALKRELITIRRMAWPLRDAVGRWLREEGPRMGKEMRPYLRDLYDHTIQVMDIVEAMRDVSASLMDGYLSALGQKTNEVMKVLTIIATLFIPLSFITGLYGMNFDPRVSPWNMPELKWRYGYPFALALMAAVCTGLLLYFRRKGWLGRGD